MTPTPLIIDCDPGLDDAITLLLAMASPEEIDLLGITTVVGNVPLTYVQENARRMCELAGRRDMKVYKGCSRAVFGRGSSPEDTHAAHIHGETGLGEWKCPPPTMALQTQHGVNFIIETLLNAPHPITLAPTGPLTNIACALIMNPQIKEKIEKIVLMGGAMGLGNITPTAEFNFYFDPQAAHIVFTAGVPIVMMGLDVTRQTVVSETWLQTLEALKTPVSRAVVDMLSYYHRPDALFEPGMTRGVLHDPNVIAYLLNPDLYKGRHAYVEIDVSHTIMAGHSTVDWYGKLGKSPNAYVMNEVHAQGFFDLLTERLGRYKV